MLIQILGSQNAFMGFNNPFQRKNSYPDVEALLFVIVFKTYKPLLYLQNKICKFHKT